VCGSPSPWPPEICLNLAFAPAQSARFSMAVFVAGVRWCRLTSSSWKVGYASVGCRLDLHFYCSIAFITSCYLRSVCVCVCVFPAHGLSLLGYLFTCHILCPPPPWESSAKIAVAKVNRDSGARAPWWPL
jgi:hypothetical protein